MSKSVVVLFSLLVAFVSAASAQNSLNPNQISLEIEREGTEPGSIFVRARIVNETIGVEGLSAAAIRSVERQAFELVNKKRFDAGLEPLVWSGELASVARQHSQNMATYKFFSHRGLDGATVDERADRLGVRNWRAIGENIAFLRGYPDPVEFAVDRWMQSTSHRQNLLDKRWKEAGIGVAALADGTYYFTQVFLLRN